MSVSTLVPVPVPVSVLVPAIEFFKQREIDGTRLCDLNKAELMSLGVESEDADRLLLQIDELTSHSSSHQSKSIEKIVRKLCRLSNHESIPLPVKQEFARYLSIRDHLIQTYMANNMDRTEKLYKKVWGEDPTSLSDEDRFWFTLSYSGAYGQTESTFRSEQFRNELVLRKEDILKIHFVWIEEQRNVSIRHCLSPIIDAESTETNRIQTGIMVGPYFLSWGMSQISCPLYDWYISVVSKFKNISKLTFQSLFRTMLHILIVVAPGLVIPKKVYNRMTMYVKGGIFFKGPQAKKALDVVASHVCKWNSKYHFKYRSDVNGGYGRNSMAFVDSLCKALGINFGDHYILQSLRKNCMKQLSIEFHPDLAQKLGLPEHVKHFLCHQQLDEYTLALLELVPNFPKQYPFEWNCLRMLDAIFWNRYHGQTERCDTSFYYENSAYRSCPYEKYRINLTRDYFVFPRPRHHHHHHSQSNSAHQHSHRSAHQRSYSMSHVQK